MKKIAIVLTLLLLLLIPVTGLAATKTMKDFYVSGALAAETDGVPSDAVMWYKNGSKYYMFLPGAFDASNLRVWFTGTVDEITLNGKTLKNGDTTDQLIPGKSVKLKAGKKTYTLNIMQGSAIPAVFVATESGKMTKVDKSKDVKEPGMLTVVREDGTVECVEALEYVKLRGNTSATFSKKGYGLKLQKGKDLCGMGKAKKWVLVSNARDHSLLRNQIVHAMAQYVGLQYTPGCVQVEVYLNHIYNGTYILLEKVEIGESRIDIDDLGKATEMLNDQPLKSYQRLGSKSAVRGKFRYYDIPVDPDDITGGYLVEYDNWQVRYADSPSVYTSLKGKVLSVKEPEYASLKQMTYITEFMQGYENAIFASDGIDPESGKHYTEFVDFDSLVLKYMLEEVCKNCDANKSSQYFYKPADSESTVAFAGPCWDYDTSFGDYGKATAEGKDLLNPEGLHQTTVNGSDYWWPQLYRKDDFKQGVYAAWAKEYAPACRILLGLEKDETGQLLSIDEYAALIEDSAQMNFVRWPMKQSSDNIAKCGKTFSANIKYLKDFLQKRYTWLDNEWTQK